jgi:hypothetical protein
MVKNWLIRTKSNHILGPVSRDKVLELQQNGSIRSDDEVCRGNGYWFYLRETELFHRFLIEDEPQPFNPICEAPDVFRDSPPTAPIQFNDDITLFTTLPARAEVAPPPPPPGGSGMVGRRPAVEPVAETAARTSAVPPSSPGKVSRRRETPPVRPLPVAPLPQRRVSDKLIMGAAIGALVVLAAILYYRKRLISEFAHSASSLIVPTAQAQADVKKKASSIPSAPVRTTISSWPVP